MRSILEAAEADLRPVIALAGLGGLRKTEITRLDWAAVFRVSGHIEVGALKAKTRGRRLVEVCTSLGQWLEPYRGRTGAIWTKGYKEFYEDFARLRNDLKIPHRRNGLRHSFVTFHYALPADEGLTAKEAGNSPAMVHKNYKGLATKAKAGNWFNVMPSKADNRVPLRQASAGPH